MLREHRRARFVRRTGWYSFLPLWGFLWLLSRHIPWRGVGVFGDGVGSATDLLLMGAVAAGVVAILLRRIAAPVAEIVSAADRIAQRDYGVRVQVPEYGPAWVGDTARAFNAMARELDSQDAARRRLMADIAHELRTPLAVVQGTLEAFIDGVYPRDDERLQSLLENTRVLARLVEDLRTLSTAESGALALSKEPTDILALVDDVVGSMEARAKQDGIVLRVDSALAAELELISSDPLRMRQVITNLVANALRYTPPGGRVIVTVSAAPKGVEVRVTDTGSGIAPTDLPHIFDRFYKGAGSSGSGLGLTIARTLVEAHGGTIRAESTVNAGTSIVFFLPY